MGIFDKLKLWRALGIFVNIPKATLWIDPVRKIVNFITALGTRKSPGKVPWTPFTKDLAKSTVALVSTAGFYAEGQEPFDVYSARGDESYRAFPTDINPSKLKIAHEHYNLSRVKKDLNVLLPIDRLSELVADGVIGGIGPRIYSFGFGGGLTKEYIRHPDGTAHKLAKELLAEQVDFVLMVPA